MSANQKAVISLQVGHYANYVGAHFWNSQELAFQVAKENNDMDHDVFFREGLTGSNQITYTPRLVSLDLKGALGSLPQFGDLYHDVASSNVMAKTDLSAQAFDNWHSNVTIERAETHRKTKFLQDLDARESGNDQVDHEKDIDDIQKKHHQTSTDIRQMDQEVKLWSDFLMARFHPKTNVVISEFGHGSAVDPFDVFGIGVSAWSNGQAALADEFEDKVRFFAEEADFLKGFQLLHDSTDAFGGLSSQISEYIRDEFGSVSLLSFPTLPTHYNSEPSMDAIKSTSKMLNLALSIKNQVEHCNLVTPLSLASETFPLRGLGARQISSINYNWDLHYHTSAILALGLDSLTLPWRSLHGPYASPAEVAHGLSAYGRKLANLEVLAPFPKPAQDKLSSFLAMYSLQSTSMTPHVLEQDFETVWCQSVSARGIFGSGTEHLDFLGFFDRVMPKTSTAVTTSRYYIYIYTFFFY